MSNTQKKRTGKQGFSKARAGQPSGRRQELMGTRYEAKILAGKVPSTGSVAQQLEAGAVATAARYHSELAMQAARKMRRTKQKLKTGQEICHHLRMMLASDPVPPASNDAGHAGQIRLAL